MLYGKKKDINYKKIRGVNIKKALLLMNKREIYNNSWISISIVEKIVNKVAEELENKHLSPRRIMYERQMLYGKLIVRLVPDYYI